MKKKKKRKKGEEKRNTLEAYREPFYFSTGLLASFSTGSRMTRKERGKGFVRERVVKFSAEALARLKRVLIRN